MSWRKKNSAQSRSTAARGANSKTRKPAKTSSLKMRLPTPPAANPAAPCRIQRHRHPQPERRLHFRRAGGTSRRYRNRPGCEHFRRIRHLRSHSRHRAEVCRTRQSEPWFADSVGRNDAAPLGLERGGRLGNRSDGKAIGDKQVTYDFARLMDGANEVSCSAFGKAMIERM